MTDDNKVVFLKFRNTEQIEDMMSFIACRHCRNKTFLHLMDRPGDYALVKCAACGNHIGRIGWADEEET